MTVPVVVVSGGRWKNWTRVSVAYGAKQSVRAFGLSVTDNNGQPFAAAWNFMPGTAVQIMEQSDLLLTGFIDRMSPSFDQKGHKVEINGRSRSGDHVDSSIEHNTNEFKNKTPLEIGNEIDKQGVGFKSSEQLDKIDLFRTNPFESVFSGMERLTRSEQLLMIGNADGSVQLAKGGKISVNAPLVEGLNIIAASAVFDDGDRHSGYKVKGQKALGINRKAIQISEEAKDGGVTRNRPKHIPHERRTTSATAKKRAAHHRDRQMGESTSAKIRVQGWRDQNGLLYVENTLIFVFSPILKLNMQMLIESIDLTMDESGSFAEISVVHPKALGSDAGTGSNATSEWAPGF
jgi:prophage tail gpP-like protein